MTYAQDVRALIEAASADTVRVRDVELDLRDRTVVVKVVTPDLLALQDVLEEARFEAVDGEPAKEFNGRFMRKLVPKIAYADFDLDRMEGTLIFPRGDRDPVYRRFTRHPTAFAALAAAAADVVRPLQAPEDEDRSSADETTWNERVPGDSRPSVAPAASALS